MSKVRYAVPNAFTSLNFLMGTFAIALAPLDILNPSLHWAGKSCLEWATWLVVYAVLFDKLDGFFAKKLNASSEFGAQLDSLADLISFGIAPAMIVLFSLYKFEPVWFFAHLPLTIGSLCVYVLCAAYRLARYNALQSDLKGWFIGMPSTLAGGVLTVLVLLMTRSSNWFGFHFTPMPLVLTEFVLGVLMVSDLYLSKLVARQNRLINFLQIACILIGYAFGLAQVYPEILFLEVGLYAVVGFAWGLVFRKRIEAQVLHAAQD